MPARSSPLLLALALAACSTPRIRGTEIQDTPDTRAIVATIDSYRQAAERRDAEGVLALVSPTYFDDAGTPDPADDMDYAQLREMLPGHYRQLSSIKLGIGVREIVVEGDRATANVFYDGHYRVTTAAGEAPKVTSDVAQMRFVRDGKGWKITAGL
jgi:hypothetical protein